MSTATVLSFPAPLEGMSTPDLESELLGLAGHIAAAECRFLQLLAEFDARDGWAGDGIRSCAHWLSWRAGMDLRTATERLRVARALRNLPRIGEAFAAGRMSYSKVWAITRVTGSDSATLTQRAAFRPEPGTARPSNDQRCGWTPARLAPRSAERGQTSLARFGPTD